MNTLDHIFEHYAWIVLALGCFSGGIIAGYSVGRRSQKSETKPRP